MGTISETSANEYWSFDGTEGQNISVLLERFDSELEARITILDSNGSELSRDFLSGSDENASIRYSSLPSSGTYYLRVFGFGSRIGAYELTLSLEEN